MSRELVTGMAQSGLGFAEYVVPGERLDIKVMRQLKRAMLPAFSDVCWLEWCLMGDCEAYTGRCHVHAPHDIRCSYAFTYTPTRSHMRTF